MSSERAAARHIPLASPFGRQIQQRGTVRDWILSAAFHVVLVGGLIWLGRALEEMARVPGHGPGLGGGGGGGGNRVFAVFTVPAAAAAVPPTPALVLPTQLSLRIPEVKLPDSVPRPPSAAELAQQIAGMGPGQGPGQGSGTGPGSGSGTGGGIGSGIGPGVGSDSGGAGRIFPPRLDGIILPPAGRPSSLAGVQITVRFDVSDRGEVLDVTLNPPIRDRGYRNEFMDRMKRYVFTPAHTIEGRPVRALYDVNIRL